MSPAGPSTLDDAVSSFGQIDWTRDSMRVTAFATNDRWDGLFQLGNVQSDQNDWTYNIDFSDTRPVGERQTFTYGGNFRYNTYDNDLTPLGDSRDSYGMFLQDEIDITDMLRVVAGARWDYVDPMGSEVSPRASLIVSPFEGQSFRFSYNHAFQAPSVLQNYIDFTNGALFLFPDFNNPGSSDVIPVFIPFRTVGDVDLEPKRLDAFEIGWMGRIGSSLRLSAVGYVNEFENAFQTIPTGFFTSSDPPPGWPFDPALLDGPLANALVSGTTIANLGSSTEKGVEVGGAFQVGLEWDFYANWSWQDRPELQDFGSFTLANGTSQPAVNIPPQHMINVGASWDNARYFANANLNYQDDAFWTDVLDARFWGPTESFTMVNAGAGVRLADGDLVLSLNGINVFDENVIQHVWGDIIGRRITGQVAYRF
jgi:outer membrane receptor protein involved in Fe transport